MNGNMIQQDLLEIDGGYYLDNAATRPMTDALWEEMSRIRRDCLINSSSNHNSGLRAKRYLEDARKILIEEIAGESRYKLVFNSGSTEGINHYCTSHFLSGSSKQPGFRVVTTKIEHNSILRTLNHLEGYGAQVIYCPVDEFGRIRIDKLEEILQKGGVELVAISHVNSELGCVNDIKSIGNLAGKYGAKFLVDATQSFGKRKIDVEECNVTALVCSGHKIGSFQGIGFLCFKRNCNLSPLLNGGGQELGLRSGTVNVFGAVSMAKALIDMKRIIPFSFDELPKTIFGSFSVEPAFSNYKDERVFSPWIVPCRTSVDSQHFLLQTKHFISAGSACSSGVNDFSFVYKSIFRDFQHIVRLSF